MYIFDITVITKYMRVLFICILIIPFYVYPQAKTAKELLSDHLKKYTLERGKISYEISGDATGEEVLIFAHFGWKSMRQQTMIFELYGIQTIQTLHEITNGDFVYRLNKGDSTLVTKKDFKWSQQAAYKEPEEVSEAILFSLGGTQVADSTLFNRTCEVWTFEHKALQELWIWKGLVLKRKTKLGDRMIYSTVKAMELDMDPDETLFNIPTYMKEKK